MNVIQFPSQFRRAAGKTAALTPFERKIAIEFAKYKGHPEHGHLFVTLDPQPNGSYNAAKRHEAHIPAVLDMFPIDKNEDPIFVMEAAKGFFGAPRDTVMILNLHGAPLEEQIPEWKTGTVVSPEQFLCYPVISVVPPEPEEMSEDAQRFFTNVCSQHLQA